MFVAYENDQHEMVIFLLRDGAHDLGQNTKRALSEGGRMLPELVNDYPKFKNDPSIKATSRILGLQRR
jgi:hypothetical protein